MQRRVLVALAFSGLFAIAHCGVLVVDSRENAYLTGNSESKWSKKKLNGLIAALTGLQPGGDIDAAASQQIASLVKPNPFKKPQAHVALTLAGVSSEEVASLFAGRQQAAVSLEEDEHIADAVMDLFTSLASANPDVPFQLLDKLAALNCRGASCLQEYMPEIAQRIGAEYKSDTNQLVLADGTELDLFQLADKAFATELLSATAGVQNLLQSVQQHGAKDVTVVDLTVLGLQGLEAKYGPGSAEAEGAKAALTKALQWTMQQLDDLFDGDVTVQVAMFDQSPSAESVDSAMAWKEQRHSRMLAATITLSNGTSNGTFPGSDEEQVISAKQFATKAAGYGGFILLLYFMLGGVYCLCNMPFKKDSLLYGSKKE